jgi:hypothetical protein
MYLGNMFLYCTDNEHHQNNILLKLDICCRVSRDMYGAVGKILLEHTIQMSDLLVWRTWSHQTMELNSGLPKADRS